MVSFIPILQRLLEDPDRYLELIRTDADGFAQSMMGQKRDLASPLGAIPTLQSVAIHVFRPDGSVVRELCPEGWPKDMAFEHLFEQLPPVQQPPRILFLRWQPQHNLSAVCLSNVNASKMNLPLSIREGLQEHPDSRLLMSTNAIIGSKALDAATESYGLTGLQQRVVRTVAWKGNGRTAAEELGISYPTLREAMSQAARKVGAPNLPALVRRVVESSFGVLPTQYGNASDLSEWLPLSVRQCQISEMIAEGISRQAVASALRISTAVVKKELEQVFAALEINSSAVLSRIWAEAQGLRFFASATDGPLGFFDPSTEPTRFLPRADDHQVITWSDYGPASGKPVLIIHSNWTCRAVPREMVIRLQAAGWRPIAIDRPGFGRTHPGDLTIANPYEQGVADTANVLDRLKIQRTAVITRRAGQFTTVLKQALGDRIGPIILTSPSPPTTSAGRRAGIVGVIKEAFFRSPQLVELYFRMITPQMSLKRMEKLTVEICKGSPPDEKLARDPQFIRDRYRAIRPFSTGNLEGAIIEEMQVSRNLFDLEPQFSRDTLILHGAHDNHYSFDEVSAYWSRMWPNAEVRQIEDGGQFLTSSHPALLVELLDELEARSN